MTDRPPHDPDLDARPQADWESGPPSSPPSNGTGLAALIVGVVALILAVPLVPLGILLGIVAIVLGVLGRKKVARHEATNKGQATAGIVTGVLAVVIGGFIAATLGLLIASNSEEIGNLTDCVASAGGDTVAQEACNRQFQEELGAPAVSG